MMNGSSLRVAACVDCGTTLLGEQPRCPACHDRHSRELLDDVITAPRPRTTAPKEPRVLAIFARWVVVGEYVVAIGLLFALAIKGCG